MNLKIKQLQMEVQMRHFSRWLLRLFLTAVITLITLNAYVYGIGNKKKNNSRDVDDFSFSTE